MTRAEVFALQVVLTGIGLLLRAASYFVPRLRRQISRDLVIEVTSADGAGQRYHLHTRTRTISLRGSGPVEVRLRFATARDGLLTLLSTRTAGRIVEGMNTGGTRIDGNPVLILWFHGLTRVVFPIGRTRRPRRPAPVPVRTPETTLPYSRRIVTEPAVRELSREWPQAWAARAKLLHVRAPGGDRLPPG